MASEDAHTERGKELKNFLKNLVLQAIPRQVRGWCVRENPTFNDLLNEVAAVSYSQQGEDLAVEEHFRDVQNGFFIDIGAFHPVRYSNTYKLYERGWNGINIEANPDVIYEFEKIRPRDINLNVGIGGTKSELVFYKFNQPTLNTFCPEHAARWSERSGFHIVEKVVVKTRTLEDVLTECVPTEQKIHFMSIDVEGFDLKVLQSNDWQRFVPAVLLVEGSLNWKEPPADHRIVKYLTQQNYVLWEVIRGNLLFKHHDTV